MLTGIFSDPKKSPLQVTQNKLLNMPIMYSYCGIHKLCNLLEQNKKLLESFENMMSEHRENDFQMSDFIHENKINKLNGIKTKYLFSYINDEIVTISRIAISGDSDKTAFISAVHTNNNFRNNGFCKKTINLLINLTKSKYNVSNFTLYVKTENDIAIKCYQNCGFTIINSANYENDNIVYFKMVLRTKN